MGYFFTFLLSIVILVLAYIINGFKGVLRGEKRPLAAPTVGLQDSYHLWAWACVRSVWKTASWVSIGYEKYNKIHGLFVVPTLDHGPTYVLPKKMIKNVYSLPEEVLDVHRVQDETMQLPWVFPDKHILGERLQFEVVRSQLTRSIPRITSCVAEEIDFGFSRSWGHDPDWKPVRVWTSTLRIIAGAANGVFCGKPLCRDTIFLDRMKNHAMTIFAGAIGLNCFPRALHCILGPLLSALSGFVGWRAMKRSLPTVQARLEQTASWKSNPQSDWTPPDDALQWIIDECYKSKSPQDQLQPKRVCQRLLFVNDVSLLTTAYTAQNFILDLFSTDPSLGYVTALRRECQEALRKSGGHWTHEAVTDLHLVDSAIRESMRMNPFGTLALPRQVVRPNGLNIPPESLQLPYKARIALPTEAIQYDEDTYPEAHQYKPFRFVSSRADSSHKLLKSTVTLDENFLAFGVPGRWACPGRFFALLELKIFVAQLLLHYDVEYLPARPRPIYMMWARYPPDTTIRIRRRQNSFEG